ncbi:hypothetical protein Tco_1173112 [Tanacetum coccineum]
MGKVCRSGTTIGGSSPSDLKLSRENFYSRIKEEDSITNVENAVLDLGVMDPLCRSKSSHRPDHEVHLIHSLELFSDHPRSQGHNCNALRPNRPYAQARWEDDKPFRTPTCKECIRWVS